MFFRSFPHQAGRSRAGHNTQLLERGRRRRRRSHQVQGSAWLRAVPTPKVALQHLHQGGWKPSSPLPAMWEACAASCSSPMWFHRHTQDNGHIMDRAIYRHTWASAPPKNNCTADSYLLLSCYLVYLQSC